MDCPQIPFSGLLGPGRGSENIPHRRQEYLLSQLNVKGIVH